MCHSDAPIACHAQRSNGQLERRTQRPLSEFGLFFLIPSRARGHTLEPHTHTPQKKTSSRNIGTRCHIRNRTAAFTKQYGFKWNRLCMASGTLWEPFGTFWASLAALSGPLGDSLGTQYRSLKLRWDTSETLSGFLGVPEERLGVSLGPLGFIRPNNTPHNVQNWPRGLLQGCT